MFNEYELLWAMWGGIRSKDHLEIVLARFGDLKTAWKAADADFLRSLKYGDEKIKNLLETRTKLDFAATVDRIKKVGITLMAVGHADFPEPLREAKYAPAFLFVRGTLPPLHKAMAVVGTRTISPYGRYAAERFTSGLAACGWVIVSGLALGVDGVAHRVALECGAPTVAVLGSGVDLITPERHEGLARQILAAGGAIISEYPPGTPALAHHFPDRNRIISGLSRGVVVVEGAVDSGSLITARYGLEQGRHVFAVPSPLQNGGLSGPNKIIKKSEAKLVESVADILEDFRMAAAPGEHVPVELDETEKQVLALLSKGARPFDALSHEMHLNVARLSEILIGLQFKNCAREMGGEWILA